MRGKVLIVDDEPLVRKGLAKMIEECPVSWSIAGEAQDGSEALALIGETSPDLVITDIRMPVMDGLELCKHISHGNRPIDIVVLTAHKDFEFAQASLRYGASDFLLKPWSAEELTRSLEKAYRSYAARQSEKERQQAERRRLQEHNIRSWLLGLPLDGQAAEGLRAEWVGKRLTAFEIESYTPAGRAYRREDAPLLEFAVHNVMEELYRAHMCEGHLISVKHDLFAVLAAPSPSLDRFAEQVHSHAKQLLGLTLKELRFGDARLEDGYGRLAAQGGKRLAGVGVADSPGRSRTIQSEIMGYLIQGRTEQLREYFERFAGRIGDLSAGEAKVEALGLALALTEIDKREFSAESDREGDVGEWVRELQSIERSEEAALWVSGPAERFMGQFQAWLSGKNVNWFDKAIRFIERNYGAACSIHDVAQHVHLSVSYFSNLFKKETGDSYTNYLTKFRLEKARILLCHTNMKIAEIAESVGYDDPNYFTTVFRQWQQCSPSEFRKQYKAP